jgi:hypothetical protein
MVSYELHVQNEFDLVFSYLYIASAFGIWDNLDQHNGPVHPAYNPYFSAYFSVKTVFFSHNKSANSVFQPAYQHSRTGQYLISPSK